jgi:hypothetical protein
MPPPPRQPLSDYELTVLGRWATASKASLQEVRPNTKPTARIIQGATQIPGTNRST